MKKSPFTFVIILLLLPLMSIATENVHWKKLTKGLEYTEFYPELDGQEGSIHAFRIDLHYLKLNSILARDLKVSSFYVSDAVQAHHALLAINGGFFSPQEMTLGLRVQDGLIKSPVKKTSWWGIFFVKRQMAGILSQKEYTNSTGYSFAVQAGPRLIVNGVIPKLKDSRDYRSALGITRDGKVIMLVTDDLMLSTTELANIMSRAENQGGLACVNALNLDGGSSTQLYASIAGFNLSIPSIRAIADAVVVEPRSAEYFGE